MFPRGAVGLGKEGGCKGAVLCRAAGAAPCIARWLCAPAGLGAGQQCLWGEKGKGRGLQSSGSLRAHRPSLGVPVLLAGAWRHAAAPGSRCSFSQSPSQM